MPEPLTTDDQEAMRALWTVYGPRYDAIAQASRENFEDHPEIGSLMREAPGLAALDAGSRRLLENAMAHGEWDAYWRGVAAQGSTYAEAGVSLRAWAEVVNFVRLHLKREIFATLKGDVAQLEAVILAVGRWLDDVLGIFAQSFVDSKQAIVEQQASAIRALSTPVLQVLPKILVLPIIGMLDEDRVRRLGEELLRAISARRARAAVLDITGVPDLDTFSASSLLSIVHAARLMGARVILSGMSAEIASALATVGVDLEGIESVGDLESGLERATVLVSSSR